MMMMVVVGEELIMAGKYRGGDVARGDWERDGGCVFGIGGGGGEMEGETRGGVCEEVLESE